MQAWINIWTAVLLIGVLMFAGLSIVITIGGVGDLKELLRSMSERQRESDASDDSVS